MFSAGKRKVVENFFAISSVQAANYILPLLTLPYLIRVLGPEKYGLINFAGALIGYFGVLTDYGFGFSATQEIAVSRKDKRRISEIFVAVLLIKAGLVFVSLVILCGLLISVPRFGEYPVLYLLTFSGIVGNALFPVWFFQGIERMKYVTFLNVLAKSIFALSIFVVVKQPADYFYVPLLHSAGFIVAGILGLMIAVRNFDLQLCWPSLGEVIHQLRKGWYVFIATVSVSAYTGTRVFAVGLLTNNTITGYYVLAEKLMNIVQMVPLAALLHAVYPRLSYIYASDPARSFRLMRQLQNYTTLAFMIVLPIVFVLAPWIVLITTGATYPETVLAFRLLLVAVLFINANTFRVHFLLVAGQVKASSRIHIVAGVLGIIGTFMATYWFSYVGTTAVIIGVELLVLWMTVRNLKANFREA